MTGSIAIACTPYWCLYSVWTGDPVHVLDAMEAAAAAVSSPANTTTHRGEGDDADLRLQLAEDIQNCNGLGVICGFELGTLSLVALRLGDGSVTLGGLELRMMEPRDWMVFISHAQLEAQNQCALLVRLLAEVGVDVRLRISFRVLLMSCAL